MDAQTAKYIVDQYFFLLPLIERGPIQMTLADFLTLSLNPDDPVATIVRDYPTKLYREYGWISDDQDSSHMMKIGPDQFNILVASKIKEKYESEIFFNNCPKCGKLCRTARAKQCRYCGHDWH
ncbi:hypothetical protein [Chitinophaga sp.]|uniref:hypothetical protein n=1 Tax=Chitinophaga sp. TaxID=1869181 RepID=UPI0031E3D06B